MRIMKMLPCIFVNHGGGPMHLNRSSRDPIKSQLLKVGKLFSQEENKPSSILVISAHHESSRALRVSSGFTSNAYTEEEYPVKADPELAKRVQTLLKEKQIPCNLDNRHNLDHGALTPLMIAFPKAEIPVTALSLHSSMDPEMHLKIGEALQPLREEGVLIMGSGMSYHNLGSLMIPKLFGKSKGYDFDNNLNKAITHSDPVTRNELLKKWEEFPGARKVHPREEHLMPLLVVAGAAGSDVGEQRESFHFLGAAVSSFSFP